VASQDGLRDELLRLGDVLIKMVSKVCTNLDAEITENIAKKRSSRITRRVESDRILFESIRLNLLSQRIILDRALGLRELTDDDVKQLGDYKVRIAECLRQFKGWPSKDHNPRIQPDHVRGIGSRKARERPRSDFQAQGIAQGPQGRNRALESPA
jgi:hypothetical protein